MHEHDRTERLRRAPIRVRIATALVLAAAAAIAAGCGEKEEPDVASLPAEPLPGATIADQRKPPAEEPGAGAGDERRDGAGASPSRDAARTVEAYIEWIDSANGRALCTLLTEDALAELELPVRRGGCAASLSASIGYRAPRGAPVFEGVQLRGTQASLSGRTARVRASVSTTFADRGQPSIEDDVVYLTRAGGEWLVAKPSATLYRAIGSEPPLRAITPP